MNIHSKLLKIQSELKCSKNQYNSFGNYKYRSCEDILEAVKPLLEENKISIVINDLVELIGDRYYIKSEVVLTDIETLETVKSVAYAREEEVKKGMDSSQITGATSSYARKYALNGMFCIDDTKDQDYMSSINKPTTNKARTSTSINKLKELIEKAGHKESDLLKVVNKKFNKQKLEDLTEIEIQQLVNVYKSIKKK